MMRRARAPFDEGVDGDLQGTARQRFDDARVVGRLEGGERIVAPVATEAQGIDDQHVVVGRRRAIGCRQGERQRGPGGQDCRPTQGLATRDAGRFKMHGLRAPFA